MKCDICDRELEANEETGTWWSIMDPFDMESHFCSFDCLAEHVADVLDLDAGETNPE